MLCRGVKNVPIIQYLAMVTGTLAVITSGMHYGWPSPSLPKLLDANSTIIITNDEGWWIVTIPLAGALCGSIAGALMLDVFGRKKIILLSTFPYCAPWIIIAFVESFPFLLVARFIAGVGDGLAYCALPMYFGEIADPRIRGILGSSISYTRILGTFLINVLGSYLTITTTALISAIFPVLCLITFCWMPESPYYLIMKGRSDEAKHCLLRLNGQREVEADLDRMTKAVEDHNKPSGSRMELFTVKSNRKALFIGVGTRVVQQLCGTAALTFYAHTIFHDAKTVISANTAAIIYFGIQVILCGISSMIVDKTGRKPLLIISIIGSGLALFIQGVYFYILNMTDIDTKAFAWIPIAALVFYVVIFSIGMQTIPILLVGELFPTNVKAFALTYVDISFSVTVLIVTKLFQFTKDTFGFYVPFFGFTLCCVLGLFFIIFFVPETKGKTLEEIQAELKGEQTAVIEDSRDKYRSVLDT